MYDKELTFNLFCILGGLLAIVFLSFLCFIAYQEEKKSNEMKVEMIMDFIEKNYELKEGVE